MWAAVWEPRVIWQGRFDPSTGAATIIVEPGDSPLRFKAGSWVKPLSVAINGTDVPERTLSAHWFETASGKWRHALSTEVHTEADYEHLLRVLEATR